MSLFGSLYTAVSGLSAQSQATAIISNNIANVNTTGFKRSEAAFAALVTVESASAKYSPGAVKVNRLQRVDQQGQIQQTSSTTDISIAGDGFLTVRAENSLDVQGDFKFTRNGQFNEDDEGILQNSAGMYLYGWEVDPEFSDRNVIDDTVYNPDLSALVPVDVSLANGQSRQTTDGSLGLNLDADEVARSIDYGTGVVNFPTNDIDFSRTLRVYDSLGSAQDLTFEYIKINGPQAATTSSVVDLEADDILTDSPLNLTDGHSFDIDIDGGATNDTFTVTLTSTVNDIIQFVNNVGGGGIAEAFLNADGQLVITAVDPTVDLTLTNNGADTALDDLGFVSGATITPFGALPPGNNIIPPNLDSEFPQLANDPYVSPISNAYNSRGWWQVNVVSSSNPAVTVSQGFINFNSDGTLNAQTDLDGNRNIELRDIDWGNGSEIQDINVDIAGFTQFAGLYNVSYANQNGAELGLKTGIEIDREGYVNARFSNGTLSRLYKLPITTFTSQTNLQEISTTSYRESAESGEPLLQEAGVSQAGFLEVNSIEQSNVDLADEFTKLIVTQRAYSANTKVITTVDQMSEDLLRLR